MTDAIIAIVTEIATTLVVTLLGVLAAWLAAKLSKRLELSNLSAAVQDLIQLAQMTAAELQQTIVDNLKASRADGKLTEEEIHALGETLRVKTIEKMSAPTLQILRGASVDINAIIRGAGESWINYIKTIPSTDKEIQAE